MDNKYKDDTMQAESFALLPVETFNKIMWRSGNPDLAPLFETDPGRYLGEFRSMVSLPATADREAITFPVLPWKVVTRKAGRETYTRYSTTEMIFRPITARLRYVLYQRDAQGQKVKENNRDVIVSISKTFTKGSGYSPQKEVFGYVYNEKWEFASYGLLSLDGWSSFISYDKSAQAFEKLNTIENKLPVYRLGTRGVKVGDEIFPKTRKYNGGESVDIEPLDLHAPMYIEANEDFDSIWTSAQAWKNCPRWNAEKNYAGAKPVEMIEPSFADEDFHYQP